MVAGVRPGVLALSLLAVAAGGRGTFDAWLAQPPLAQQPPPPIDNGAIAATIAQWRALQQTDGLPFDSYAGFLMAHPGWPGEAANRRAAERQAAAGTGSAGSVAAYFRRFPPTTGGGWAAYARALAATGQPVVAGDAVRRAWRSASLSASDESYLLTAFPGSLTSDDHDARIDALLWAGQAATASRILPLTSPAKRPLFAARVSLRSGGVDAASVAAANSYASDAGFVADRAAYLKNAGQWDAARAALAAPHRFTAPPSYPAVWLDTLWANARAAAADRQWQLAYDIGRQLDDAYPVATDVGAQTYGERDDYTNLAWTAGRAALKQLGRPADAKTLFDRYARASHSPTIRAKGFYWAGRAAEAAGDTIGATAYLAQAAGYRDQYYGQLAAERMGKTLAAPPLLGPASVDPATRTAFYARETVRAARFLGPIGQHQDQTLFLRQIAQDAKSDTDHLLAAELSRLLGRPDLGVMVGRSALVNGLSDYSSAGFPTMPVPTGYEPSWTIIHAISRQESQFDRAAISHAGARGLMQLMPGTAREQAGKIGLPYNAAALTTDPQLSMMLGSSYFQRLFNQFGSYPLAIAAYNAGGGNVNRWLAANGDPRQGTADMVEWIEAIPIGETRGYVQRVLENAVVYDLIDPSRGLSGTRGAAQLVSGQGAAGLAARVEQRPNYITPAGYAALRAEYDALFASERPALVETVSWAAGNGDRSENGDYLYGKKRLREIDRRLGWLAKRMKAAKVVDPAAQPDRSRAWFGANVTIADEDDRERTLTLVGDDETDAGAGRIGWNAPLARALRGAAVGDVRRVELPGGEREYEVTAIAYPPFRHPGLDPGSSLPPGRKLDAGSRPA